mmetsp:Transcript_40410/g.53193  ORF Transcript_40410/g.53193 Transcript_40410/m.53193 type:complete len:100 (+) Transcript_40410:266-565(+)
MINQIYFFRRLLISARRALRAAFIGGIGEDETAPVGALAGGVATGGFFGESCKLSVTLNPDVCRFAESGVENTGTLCSLSTIGALLLSLEFWVGESCVG